MTQTKADGDGSRKLAKALDDHLNGASAPDWSGIENNIFLDNPSQDVAESGKKPANTVYDESDAAISDIIPRFSLQSLVDKYNASGQTSARQFRERMTVEKEGEITTVYTRQRYKTIDAMMVSSKYIDDEWHDEFATFTLKDGDIDSAEMATKGWVYEKTGRNERTSSSLYHDIGFGTAMALGLAGSIVSVYLKHRYGLGDTIPVVGWSLSMFGIWAGILGLSAKLDNKREESLIKKPVRYNDEALVGFRETDILYEGDAAIERINELTKPITPKGRGKAGIEQYAAEE